MAHSVYMKLRIAIMVMVICILSGCSALNLSKDPIKVLSKNAWELSELLGATVNPLDFSKGLPNLNFSSDGKLSGFGGCNSLMSNFNIEENKLNLSPVAATRMACQGVRENEFLNVLERVKEFKIEKDRLVLSDGSQVLMALKPKK